MQMNIKTNTSISEISTQYIKHTDKMKILSWGSDTTKRNEEKQGLKAKNQPQVDLCKDL